MKIIPILFLGLLLPLLSAKSADAEKRWWDHELTFDSLPNEQTPPWLSRGKGGTATIENGKLVIETLDESQSIAFVLEEPASHDTVTVEFRVKARETLARFAAQFNVSVSGTVYVLPITNTEEVTYRMVLENNVMTLYRDGEDASVIKPSSDIRNKDQSTRLLFGDASSAALGTTEWSKLRWAWGKAVHGD